MKTKTLTLIDGLIWLVAGINVCKIGVTSWKCLDSTSVMMIVGCMVTLMLFSVMFVKMLFKNVRRIQKIDIGKRRIWDIMPIKSYVIMAFMITLGILLRHCPIIPLSFIAWFYVGLGAALSLAGIIYLSAILCPKDL